MSVPLRVKLEPLRYLIPGSCPLNYPGYWDSMWRVDKPFGNIKLSLCFARIMIFFMEWYGHIWILQSSAIALDLTEFCNGGPKQAAARFARNVVQAVPESLGSRRAKTEVLWFSFHIGMNQQALSLQPSDVCFCYAQDATNEPPAALSQQELLS